MAENKTSLFKTDAARSYPLSFQGKGGAYFRIAFMNLLLTILTLGLYYPWAKARSMHFFYNNSTFNNQHFTFHGSGKEMFKGFIKAFFILILIYAGLFIGIYFNQIIAGVTWFILGFLFIIPLAIHGSYKYRMSRSSWNEIRFGYHGNRKEFTLLFFKEFFFTIITLGLYGAWMTIKLRTYLLSNIRLGNAVFRYQGNGGDYFLINLKGYFLTLLTLGIYFFRWQKELFAYYVDHLSLQHEDQNIQFKSLAKGIDFFSLILVNFLMILFSFGLATPWAITRTLTFLFSKIQITGTINTEKLRDTESDFSDATGEDLADMLDLGFII